MAERTPFAGLLALSPGELLSTDGFAFQAQNPWIIDRLLRSAVLTHRHDGADALANPTLDPTVATGTSGGTIPAGLSISVAYTLLDAQGGESAASPVEIASTQSPLQTPDLAPALTLDHTAGGLLAGSYSYAVTVTDGLGGETALGPAATLTISPGHANSRITVDDLMDIVADAGGTGYRLWRRRDGGRWALVAWGSTDPVVDDGTLCPDCAGVPPTTSSSRTNSVNILTVTVPGGQPADAVGFRIYATTQGAFTSPALLGTYDIDDVATPIVFTELAPQRGVPPVISLTVPGAYQLSAEDLLDMRWQQPVVDEASLPTSGNTAGDVRIALAELTIWGWDGAAWQPLGGGGGTWREPVVDYPSLPSADNVAGDARVVLDEGKVYLWDATIEGWFQVGGGYVIGYSEGVELSPSPIQVIDVTGGGATATFDEGSGTYLLDVPEVVIPEIPDPTPIIAHDEGVELSSSRVEIIDVTGPGASASFDAGTLTIDVPAPPTSAFDDTALVITTGALAAAARETDDIDAGSGMSIVTAITTDRAARVRLYPTLAKATADASRLISVDPSATAACELEIATGGAETVLIAPAATVWSTADLAYVIDNLSGSTSTVQVTIERRVIPDA